MSHRKYERPRHGSLGFSPRKRAARSKGVRIRVLTNSLASNDAPLAHAVPGLRRYVQNHIRGERTRADIEATNVEIDGVAELWFDDQAALERAAQTPEMKALHADGAKFIGRIKSWVVEEKTIVG